MIDNKLNSAIDTLANEFGKLDFSYHIIPNTNEKATYWLGSEDEDIKICVLKDKNLKEDFHKQDFFFLNYAYKNSYQALSDNSNNLITINEYECYIAQPGNGYALKGNEKDDIIVIGVLIKKDTFFKEYFSNIATSSFLFDFFLDTNNSNDKFIKLNFDKCSQFRKLLEIMVVEYANKDDNTQNILKSLVLALLFDVSRTYKKQYLMEATTLSLENQIVQYINDNYDNVTLEKIAKYFGYHPNYISSLLHKRLGKTFSNILLDVRMLKAQKLLDGTSLSVGEISEILGYSDESNFYKVYKNYYKKTPRK